MADNKLLSFDAVTALLPRAKGDLVTPLAGIMQGTIFKVRDFLGEQCVVRQPGKRPRKNEPDPTFLVSDLAQVYPAFR